MGGIVGRLFREFAVTLSVAVAVSALVSLTLTPMMCSRLLRPLAHEQGRGRLYRLSEAVFSSALGVYDRGLRWVLRHTLLMQAVTALTVVLTVALYVLVPKGLFPQQDTGLLAGFTQGPQDVSFPAMRKRQETVNAVVRADPDVDHFVSFMGASNGSTGNTGTVFIQLKPKPIRTKSADEVLARLRGKLAHVEGIALFLQAVQDVRVGGRSSRTQYQYTLQSADLAALEKWAPRALARIQKLPELKDVASDQLTAGLELFLTIDRDTAARLGISTETIDSTLYDAFGQREVATTYTQLNEYRVILEVKPSFFAGPASLDIGLPRLARGRGGPPLDADARDPGEHGARPSITRVNSPRSRSPSTSRRASRSARRSTPSTASSTRSACPRA